jgi:hypothetical protein
LPRLRPCTRCLAPSLISLTPLNPTHKSLTPQRLFELNPSQPYLQYEPRDVGVFIDSMPHIGLLM